jgi:ADP-heptose:LPS heptosyltransferase
MTAAHRLRRMLASPFAQRPFGLQRLRWPNPFRPPYLQAEINLYRPGELGDVVMCLAVVRAIREKNPAARITFITNYRALLAGHPLLDRVMSEEEARAARLRNIISLRYEVFIPPKLHIIDYFAGCVGLKNIAHEIPLPDFTSELPDIRELIPHPRPWIMLCRSAGPFTPNKDWPAENWDDLIRLLADRATVVELGATPGNSPPLSERHIDLRGTTTLRQFCALISLADLVISPVTSAVHIAAAYNVPTLSILGGYELPENTRYPRHTTFYRAVPCSPCWLREPCPFDRKCLRMIPVEEVAAAAERMLRETIAARG